MKVTNAEKIAVIRKICREDIESFGRFFFQNHLKLPTPDFHKEIFTLLESDSKRVAVGAPRSHAKSTIVDLVYLAWCIVNRKVNFVMLISDTYSQSVLFLESLKAELESNEYLKTVYGTLTSKTWSEGEIITNGILVKALGAGSKVRGLKYLNSRPDLILVDDLENDELVESKERREKLERWFNGALVPALTKEGRLVIIGTILHYDSLLYKILDTKQYLDFEKRTYKALNNGKALWPEHLNEAELELIKKDYIEKGQAYLFYQEYQNDPISDENRKFKIEKIKYYNEELLEGKLINNYLMIDRAYSLEKTADFTAFVVVSVDRENNWYVRVAERLRGEEKDVIKRIVDLVDYYEPTKSGAEQKAFKWTLLPALQDEMRRQNKFFIIKELKDKGQSKNLRIEGLLPRIENETVFFLRNQTDLIDELIRFPKAPYDDLSDALSYCLQLAEVPISNNSSVEDVIEEWDTGEYGLN